MLFACVQIHDPSGLIMPVKPAWKFKNAKRPCNHESIAGWLSGRASWIGGLGKRCGFFNRPCRMPLLDRRLNELT